jgi:hypothetical protein
MSACASHVNHTSLPRLRNDHAPLPGNAAISASVTIPSAARPAARLRTSAKGYARRRLVGGAGFGEGIGSDASLRMEWSNCSARATVWGMSTTWAGEAGTEGPATELGRGSNEAEDGELRRGA